MAARRLAMDDLQERVRLHRMGTGAREVARLLVKCGALMPQGDSATRKERMPDGALMRVYRVLPAIWDAVP